MFASWPPLAALVFGLAFQAGHLVPREAPLYSGASTVNAADNLSGAFAPNTIATIYGKNLAYITRALTSDDVHGGVIPSALPGTGLRVLVGNIPAGIYYVSPTQINFLIPSILGVGPSTITVAIDGLHGPILPVQIGPAAPAFFQLDAQNVVATQPDGTVITPQNPAKPGDYVVLYATGLGAVVPPLDDREVPPAAQWIEDLSALAITLDGTPLDASAILYAGVAPGFAGLYQVNIKLPDKVGVNPEIRALMKGQSSPAGIRVPVQ